MAALCKARKKPSRVNEGDTTGHSFLGDEGSTARFTRTIEHDTPSWTKIITINHNSTNSKTWNPAIPGLITGGLCALVKPGFLFESGTLSCFFNNESTGSGVLACGAKVTSEQFFT